MSLAIVLQEQKYETPNQLNYYESIIRAIALHFKHTPIFLLATKTCQYNKQVTAENFISLPLLYSDDRLLTSLRNNAIIKKNVKKHGVTQIIFINQLPSFTPKISYRFIAFNNYWERYNRTSTIYKHLIKRKLINQLLTAQSIIQVNTFIRPDLLEHVAIISKVHTLIADCTFTNIKLTDEVDKQQEHPLMPDKKMPHLLFLCNDIADDSLVTVLKIFSVFKKWQRSNMKLVMVNFSNRKDTLFLTKLSSFSFKADVDYVTTNTINDLESLIKEAFLLLLPFGINDLEGYVFNAMANGIPTLTKENEITKQLLSDANLLIIDDAVKNIGQQISLLYKDERLKKRIGLSLQQKYGTFEINKQLAQLLV
ncbi:MAG: hypothetical protein QM528_08075 [Phycisphaerales bacterium]|nr:hypothetical protein [Phycisphaerales bacterium]